MTGRGLSLRVGGNMVAFSGEAIQPEKALTLDCFASLAMTGHRHCEGGDRSNPDGKALTRKSSAPVRPG
ncbi:MAG: hypothetical protein LBT00_11940 [Spirochaetaceae bacterium]|nr:hypothetical protein [Spirochaetaceae bacterium]